MTNSEETSPLETLLAGRRSTTSFNVAAQTYPDDVEVAIRTDKYRNFADQLERNKDDDWRKSLTRDSDVDLNTVHQPMDMNWVLGINWRNAIFFLNDLPDTKSVFYSVGNAAVIYDFHLNTQKLLRGHNQMISCLTTSVDRKWLVTADKGKDSTLNIWAMKSGTPVKTFFNIHCPNGVAAVGMSIDRKFLVTLSANYPQNFAIWEWTMSSQTDEEVLVCSLAVDKKCGLQSSVYFCDNDPHCMMSSSSTHMLFYIWDYGSVDYVAFKVSKSDVAVESPGKLLKSVFHFDPTKALSSTTKGNVILWTKKSPISTFAKLPWHENWRMLKVIPINNFVITEIVSVDEYIVTGDSRGFIRFHDGNMHLLCLLQACKEGAIMSLSFSIKPLLSTERKDYVSDLTIKGRPFITRDFLFSTSKAVVGCVTRNTTKIKIISRESESAITGMDVHPLRCEICLISQSGLLRLWDYKERATLNERIYEGPLTTVSYHPTGRFLGIGFKSGDVHIVAPQNLTTIWRPRFLFTNQPILLCSFSHNSQMFACADASRAVTLMGTSKRGWYIVGKYRAHRGQIMSLCFAEDPDTHASRLFSVGLDKALVEYDLINSTKSRVKLVRRDIVEQSALPMAILMYTAPSNDFLMLYSNNQFKLKLIDMDSRRCKKLVLGPVFGSPVHKMAIVPQSSSQKTEHWFVAFAAGSLLGLQMMPPTGNPYTSMAVHAHPNKIGHVGCSYDGNYVFTLDSVSASITMWNLHLHAMDMSLQLGGKGLDAFFTLLDGGSKGKIFRELEDYFYYIHLMKQGEDSMEARAVSRTVSLDEIPFIMRALGYFPSEYEIDLMLNEVKFSKFPESLDLVTEVDIEMFLKLYLNHRPTFGISLDELDLVFERLCSRFGSTTGTGPMLMKSEFLSLLQSTGEFIFPEELKVLTEVLKEKEKVQSVQLEVERITPPLEKYLQLKTKSRTQSSTSEKMKAHDNESAIMKDIAKIMPESFTAETFLTEWLMVSPPEDAYLQEEEGCLTTNIGSSVTM